ncbi:MAG: CoA-binding protein [Calditrichaeota bacterium]|nr:CoA-binding protein [Calditrichota bacterium]
MKSEWNDRKFFQPRSLVIFGVSRKPGSLGHMFLRAVMDFGYQGAIYLIHPTADQIEGIACHRSLDTLPETPDLAVIMVRKEQVAEILESCGKKGIHLAVIITAGFRETGEAGRRREMELLEIAYKYGIRFIGPNCMGFFNTHPEIRLNASFSPTQPIPGNVAFLSQSGALAVAIMELAISLRLGFSKFVSLGNKADLTETDFLPYLLEDADSRVVMLYQEGLDRPDRFREGLYRLCRRKPVLVLKSGRSQSAARAAVSHTGALAGSTRAVDALFRQCGAISLERVQEFVETALAFSLAPLPRGPRVGVVTNAGGPGILTVDALERVGLQVRPFQESTRQRLRQLLPEEAAVENPVDMIASATQETYRETLKIVLEDESVDAVVVVIVRPPVSTTPEQIAREFQQLIGKDHEKPVMIVLMAHRDEHSGVEIFHSLNMPVFSHPDGAAWALASMWEYARWKSLPEEEMVTLSVDRDQAQHILEQAELSPRGFLAEQQAWKLLELYGFPVPRFAIVRDLEEVLDIFRTWHCPLVLKLLSPQIVHKSDVGAVRVNLQTESDIRQAWDQLQELQEKLAASTSAVCLVQEWISGSRELIAGVQKDAQLGHMIMVGLGGVLVETLEEVAFRLAPLTPRDAREMIRETRLRTWLKRTRHLEAMEESRLVDILLRLSQLVVDFPGITSLDLNPIILSDDGRRLTVVDVRMEWLGR